MRKSLTTLAFLAVIPAGAAFADDACTVPLTDWQPREAVTRLAEENGWTVRRIKIDDGCYEIDGWDQDGRQIEVEVHPGTLQVIEVEFEDDDEDHRRSSRDRQDGDDRRGTRNPAPAGPVTPPRNGLFGNGAPPQVQVN